MNFHVMTLFPEMVMNGLNTSILGRAASNGLLSFEAINIRDYTLERHGKVDDYPYGGGAGMVMQAEPIYRAYTALCDRIGHRPRVVYMTPQGRTFTQKIAEELAKEEELVFLCGHYEGVDERVLEMIATDYLSTIISWNIPSTAVPRNLWEKRCRRSFFLAIMPILKNGGGSSPLSGPWNGGQSFWRKRCSPKRKSSSWRSF